MYLLTREGGGVLGMVYIYTHIKLYTPRHVRTYRTPSPRSMRAGGLCTGPPRVRISHPSHKGGIRIYDLGITSKQVSLVGARWGDPIGIMKHVQSARGCGHLSATQQLSVFIKIIRIVPLGTVGGDMLAYHIIQRSGIIYLSTYVYAVRHNVRWYLY